MKSISSHIFLFVREGLWTDDVGVASDTASQEIRPGAGIKSGDFVEEKSGGATVVRPGTRY